MIKIFVSHAGGDATLANRFALDLKNAGHETIVDTQELRLGDDSIDFMNRGIEDADFVVILYSSLTPRAKWQRVELNGALWNEIAQDGAHCIVIRLDKTPLPPLLGPKVFHDLVPDDQNSYRQAIEKLCQRVFPKKSIESVVSEAFQSEGRNPFRRVRAEYFEDRPDLLAAAFAPPDALKMGALEDVKPCFLEGSRGTGKSMLLLSLRARNYISRTGLRDHIFGFYLKLSRGAVCNAGVSDPSGDPKMLEQDAVELADIGSQELIACLTESLLSELAFCQRQKLLSVDPAIERAAVEGVYSALYGTGGSKPSTFEDLLERLADTHRDVANFIRRRFIYAENPTVPIATFDLESFKRVVGIIRRHIPEMRNAMFVALLDEYENLFPYQQRIMNGFVKLAAPVFSVKVAKKLGTTDESGTTTGQEIQETHDYTRLPLVYDIEDADALAAYHGLVKRMIENILRSESLQAVSPSELLPDDSSPEVDPEKVLQEVAKLCKVKVDEFQTWSGEKQREKMTYYREAATYRVLYRTGRRGGEKRFCGFQDLAMVSSGVIRYFQEILSVAYHLTYGTTLPADRIVRLPADLQSRAVHFVSEHNLTTLSRNVERLGETLKYFLMDLGVCLRGKLLQHTSEPEAARVTIRDPEQLEQLELEPLRRLLQIGVREGAFQTKEGRPAFRPKHRSDPQPAEFNICRIYAPVLQISPRLRWRTPIRCRSLLGLVKPEQRARVLQQLQRDMLGPPRKRKDNGDHPDLFEP